MTRRTAVILAAGAAFGVLIRLSWNLPGDDFEWVSRVAWPWLLAAFLAGATTPDGRRAATDGALLLCSATVAYYAMLAFAEGHYAHSPVGVWWLLVAVPAGVLGGLAGSAVRYGSTGLRALALGLFAVL